MKAYGRTEATSRRPANFIIHVDRDVYAELRRRGWSGRRQTANDTIRRALRLDVKR